MDIDDELEIEAEIQRQRYGKTTQEISDILSAWLQKLQKIDAINLIDNEWPLWAKGVMDDIEKFEWLDTEVAIGLIKHMNKIEWAFKINVIDWLIHNSHFFEGSIFNKDTANALIDERNGIYVELYLHRFQWLDKEIAEKLIKWRETWRITASDPGAFGLSDSEMEDLVLDSDNPSILLLRDITRKVRKEHTDKKHKHEHDEY